ncbi:MAG TPA: hypothetical protein PK867_13675, partial [Pirellulales bacterium]|nr:hypothetical protein [Pirellulales bacterium]
MEIEPFDTVGVQGRDFVIYGEEQQPRFEARLFAGSNVLRIGWTENIPWTPFWLREVQRLAGGPGSIERIEGSATDLFAAAIRAGAIDESEIASRIRGGSGRKVVSHDNKAAGRL